MALKIEALRKEANGGVYVSDVRLYVTADDQIVPAGDSRAVRLLVGAGSTIPVAVARRYGLIRERGALRQAQDDPSAPATPSPQSAPGSGAGAGDSDGPETAYLIRHLESGEYLVLPEAEGSDWLTGDIAVAESFESAAEAQAALEALGAEGCEVVPMEIGGLDVEEVLAGNVAAVGERVAAIGDAETLRHVREAETAAAKPRKGVLSAIDARLSEIG